MKDALGRPQSVFVLGGTSDIGVATARALVERRARTVVLAGRRPDALEPICSELRGAGADRVDTVHFSALDTASHGAVVDDVFARYGDIDVVLLAFGVLGEQAEAERDPAAAVAILETNFVAAASVGLHVARHLREQGHGTLVVMSSIAGQRARPSNFIYGSSKAGLDAFFQGLGDSMLGSGANVLVVRPGFVHTKMTAHLRPQPLSVTPEKVADIIARGIETGAQEAWAPPALRLVGFVLRHLPRPLVRRLKA